jgi:PEP-CTERM motif-containing protein
MNGKSCWYFCPGLLLALLMLSTGETANAASVYYSYEGVMIDTNNSPAGPQFAAGSAFSAVFKFDDQDYLSSTPNGGGYQHEYLRGVDPGQAGPGPGDAEPTNPPDGVGLVAISFDLDNNGVVETTFLRTSTADNNGDTIDDGAPSSVGRISQADNALPGADWFKWIGSAFSKDVSVLGVPGPGWIDLWPDGDDVNPPTNADMTAIQTTLLGSGGSGSGLGILIGVGGGGAFFGDPGGVVTSFSVSSTRPPIVPEPASMMLFGLGAAFCLARGRCRR